jgi:hypothetical protein
LSANQVYIQERNYRKYEQEVGDIEDQLKNVVPNDIILEGRNIQIEHKLLFTMVDGKVK